MNQPTMKMTSMIVYGILLNCMIVQITASAIPMWEFLSRDEKMNYIYRIFTKQMADFCSTSSRPDCTKNVLFTGVQNLANMDDTTLDRLDPYQRGAEEIIWRAMVGTSKFSSRIGNRIEEESYYTNGVDPLATSGSETNVVEDDSDPMNNYARAGPYLVGPMVIRVYPDGRPVPEDVGRPLPKDDDAEEIKRTRASEEIKKSIGSNFYKIPYGRISSKGPRYSNRRASLSTEMMKTMPESRHRSNDAPHERRYHEIVRYY